jgi:alpha-amylase
MTDETTRRARGDRTFDEATELAVKTMQTRYGLPANGQWGALERMMFEEVGIHTDTPRLEALAPAKMGTLAARVSASGGARETLAPTLGARDGVMSTFGSAVAGAALGLSAAFVIGAADNARRGGGVHDFVEDARVNLLGLAGLFKPSNFKRPDARDRGVR